MSPPAARASLRATAVRLARKDKNQFFDSDEDTSDLEGLQPMKLSALTKALLGEGHPSNITSPTSRNTSIPRPTRPTSGDQESFWKRTRTPSPAGQKSPQDSAVPRKRVVRLSRPSSAVRAQAPSSSDRHQRTPREVLLSSSLRGKKSTPTTEKAAVKTPVLPVRTVRITVPSSGHQAVSAGSSASRPKRTTTSSSSATSHRYGTRSTDREVRQAPAATRSSRPTRSSEREVQQAPAAPAAAAAAAAAAAPQTSTRVKRVAKTPGSFLAGPARRGRLRQSDGEVDGQAEADAYGSGQESGSHRRPGSRESQQPLPSPAASKDHDLSASGSPVSARISALAVLRRHKSTYISPVAQQRPVDTHRPLVYRIPAPPPPAEPTNEDKENDAPVGAASPSRSTIRPNNAAVTSTRAQKTHPQSQPHVEADAAEPRQQAHVAPRDNVLAARAQNIPQRPAPPPPPKMSVVETATSAAGASAAQQGNKKKQFLLRVNGRTYTRIDALGRGASGKVYRVAAESGKLLALKRVSLEKLDERTIKAYHGEIDLLQRLTGVDRVIQLIDHEFNTEKKMLSLVLEAGELDFNTFLRGRSSDDVPFDPVFVRYWWKEMVECVQAVHSRDIIHTDLKPANFVIAQGRLKVIDFGIANAIQTDMTVNVHRDTQIGTPNYMSPESLTDFKEYALYTAQGQVRPQQLDRGKHYKLGKAADVWSLGCILYQMVYGSCPFAHIINMSARLQAIVDWKYEIGFPDTTRHGVRVPPSLIRTMRRCLNRDQSQRPTCDELLSPTDPFLYPMELSAKVFDAADRGEVIPITQALMRDVIWNVVCRTRDSDPDDKEALELWPLAYWASCKKILADPNRSAAIRKDGSA